VTGPDLDAPDLSWVKLPDDPHEALQTLLAVALDGVTTGIVSALATSLINSRGGQMPSIAELHLLRSHAKERAGRFIDDPAGANALAEMIACRLSGPEHPCDHHTAPFKGIG
jgi:hypothetical protein